jgi:hypothetical protein
MAISHGSGGMLCCPVKASGLALVTPGTVRVPRHCPQQLPPRDTPCYCRILISPKFYCLFEDLLCALPVCGRGVGDKSVFEKGPGVLNELVNDISFSRANHRHWSHLLHQTFGFLHILEHIASLGKSVILLPCMAFRCSDAKGVLHKLLKVFPGWLFVCICYTARFQLPQLERFPL